jgi:hypothetical protein
MASQTDYVIELPNNLRVKGQDDLKEVKISALFDIYIR